MSRFCTIMRVLLLRDRPEVAEADAKSTERVKGGGTEIGSGCTRSGAKMCSAPTSARFAGNEDDLPAVGERFHLKADWPGGLETNEHRPRTGCLPSMPTKFVPTFFSSMHSREPTGRSVPHLRPGGGGWSSRARAPQRSKHLSSPRTATSTVSDTPPTDLSGSHSKTGVMALRATLNAQTAMAAITITEPARQPTQDRRLEEPKCPAWAPFSSVSHDTSSGTRSCKPGFKLSRENARILSFRTVQLDSRANYGSGTPHRRCAETQQVKALSAFPSGSRNQNSTAPSVRHRRKNFTDAMDPGPAHEPEFNGKSTTSREGTWKDRRRPQIHASAWNP